MQDGLSANNHVRDSAAREFDSDPYYIRFLNTVYRLGDPDLRLDTLERVLWRQRSKHDSFFVKGIEYPEILLDVDLLGTNSVGLKSLELL